MYGRDDEIKTLCANVKSGLTSDVVAVHAKTADALIDSRLGEVFYWPNDVDGNPVNTTPPELVVQIANLLTAAEIESIKYAVNEVSGAPFGSPYAAALRKRATELIDGLVNGTVMLPGITMISPIRQSASEAVFIPPSSIRGGRSRR